MGITSPRCIKAPIANAERRDYDFTSMHEGTSRMSPTAEPTTVAAPGLTIVPARLLEGGEIVILAVKPSGWFCLLTSLPVLSVALLLTAIAYFAGDLPVPREGVMLLCAAAAALRLVAG